MNVGLNFLDLFAGAGGLSEGFIRAGFEPVAHVEMDQAACFTLRTRMAYRWLKSRSQMEHYSEYLKGKINRKDLYKMVPQSVINSTINSEIGRATLRDIFMRIDDLLGDRKIDLIIGGPPCQAYSIVGRARDRNRMKGDKRNYLYIHYAEFLKRYKPPCFIFENVTGLLSAKNIDGSLYLDAMRDLFFECGYDTELMTLSAEEYGVLQSRKRIFLFGSRNEYKGLYPSPIKWITGAKVKEVFCDLPPIYSGDGDAGPCETKPYKGTWQYRAGVRNDDLPITWHQSRPNCARDLEIYKIVVDLWNREHMRLNYNVLPDRLKTHRHRNSFVDRFKVVAADLSFSHTVVAHIAKDGHYYIHPDIDQNRSITPREAARLQTFPDDYFFESNNGPPLRTPVFRQIGNAVPVLLAQKIAESLRKVW